MVSVPGAAGPGNGNCKGSDFAAILEIIPEGKGRADTGGRWFFPPENRTVLPARGIFPDGNFEEAELLH